jgi:serine/threonine protein kinase
MTTAPFLRLAPGETFAGVYQVVSLIGDGGMGIVYRARHILLEQERALKIMKPHVATDEAAIASFRLEAAVFGRVQSDHIVRPLDVGFDEATQTHYLAMDLLEGATLEALVQRGGPMAPLRALHLLRQMALGLDAAHGCVDLDGRRSPIVHRDLKPANVFVTTARDGSDLVKILDFGLAKVLRDSGDLSVDLKGTYPYMACEQAKGERIWPQTDIWALGLIAFYVLTGCRYWRKAVPAELLVEIIQLPLEAASVRLRERYPQARIPEPFDRWLARCLDRTPTERFPSAGVAVEALGNALARAGIELDRPWVDPSVAGAGGDFGKTKPASGDDALHPTVSAPGLASGVEVSEARHRARPGWRRLRWALAAFLASGGAALMLARWHWTQQAPAVEPSIQPLAALPAAEPAPRLPQAPAGPTEASSESPTRPASPPAPLPAAAERAPAPRRSEQRALVRRPQTEKAASIPPDEAQSPSTDDAPSSAPVEPPPQRPPALSRRPVDPWSIGRASDGSSMDDDSAP